MISTLWRTTSTCPTFWMPVFTTAELNNYVQAQETASTTIRVDRDGLANGVNFVDVAILEGIDAGDAINFIFDGAGNTTSIISASAAGQNVNAPVITSANSANVAENTSDVIQVTATDGDPGDPKTFSLTGNGADDALFSIDGSGNLTFDASPDFENPGDAGTDNTYNVEVAVFDGVNTTTQAVTILVTDESDTVAIVGGVSSGDVTEDANPTTLTTNGTLTIVDPDTGEAVFTAQASTAGSNGLGTFTLDTAGNWTYSTDNTQAAIQNLAAGATITDSFTAVSSDGSANQLVTVTITGTNDTAVIGGVSTGDVTEDANPTTLTTNGALTISDTDTGQAVFTAQASTAGSNGLGTFTLDTAGNWTYSTDNTQAAIQNLAAGATITDSFTAVSSDGSANQLVTVTITGINDTAIIGGVSTGDVTEDANPTTLTTNGALTITDTDTGQAVFTAQASTAGSNGLGTFTLDTAGNWTYSTDNTQAAIQNLAAGATITDSFTAVSSDGSASQSACHGDDHRRQRHGRHRWRLSTGDVTEDTNPTTLTTNGALTITDVDTGQAVFTAQASTVGSNGLGTFTLDTAGNWTYSTDNTQAAIQNLAAGATITDSFTAVSSDGSASQPAGDCHHYRHQRHRRHRWCLNRRRHGRRQPDDPDDQRCVDHQRHRHRPGRVHGAGVDSGLQRSRRVHPRHRWKLDLRDRQHAGCDPEPGRRRHDHGQFYRSILRRQCQPACHGDDHRHQRHGRHRWCPQPAMSQKTPTRRP